MTTLASELFALKSSKSFAAWAALLASFSWVAAKELKLGKSQKSRYLVFIPTMVRRGRNINLGICFGLCLMFFLVLNRFPGLFDKETTNPRKQGSGI